MSESNESPQQGSTEPSSSPEGLETPSQTSPSRSAPRSDSRGSAIPDATVRRATPKRWSALWLLTLVAAIVAIALPVAQQRRTGVLVEVVFREGHGLKPGDVLRHRGIEVGQVGTIALADEMDRIHVSLRLAPEASSIARAGSQFWIVRPQVRPGQIAGLETILGAKFVAVQPGPAEGASQLKFEGIEAPLAMVEDGVTLVTVEFREGHGLAAGDAVKHRGIRVGEVTEVRLSDDLAKIEVQVRLFGATSPFARGGSRYWIERPSISLTEVRGLETLVTGAYLAAGAGADSAVVDRFVGIEQPRIGPLPEGGLEIVFESQQRGPLRVGTPIDHRGVEIGRIVAVGLSGDATTVEARGWIEPAYRNLVCEQSRFWNRGGVSMSVGLTGVQLDAESLQDLLVGGIGLATPDENPGAVVSTGHRFEVASEADDDWLAWSPRIPVGAHRSATGQSLPIVERVEVSWTERRWGFRSQRRRSGWGLWVEGGRIFGPRTLLLPPTEAIDGGVLEIAGRRYEIQSLPSEQYGELMALKVPDRLNDLPPWPMSRLRFTSKPEDALVILPDRDPVPLIGDRQVATSGNWQLDGSIGLSEDEAGSVVVSVNDGALIGMLAWLEDGGVIAPLVMPAPK